MTGFTYKSYNFVDKDPIIDYVRTVVQESKMLYKTIAEESGVHAGTIARMLDGETRHPRAATINAILRACNMKLAVRPMVEADAVPPTIYVRQVVSFSKYRSAKKLKAAKAAKRARA